MAFADLVADMDRVALRELGGEPITYAPAVGAPAPVTGIFDAQFVLASAGPSGVEVVTPAVFFRLADLPAGVDPETDEPTITIGGIAYAVTERRTAGMGSIVLALRAIV